MDKELRDIHIQNKHGEDVWVLREVPGTITIGRDEIIIEHDGYLGITKCKVVVPMFMDLTGYKIVID